MSDIQNVLLGGFGSTGSVSLIVTSGFSVGAEVPVVVVVPTDSLGANDRHWRQRREKRRRVPTAEEVYRQAVNPPPPPLLDVPELAAIPDEIDREIAYRIRTADAERLADRVAARAAKAKIESDMAAALLADQEDEEALFAIMSVLLEEAA